MQRAVNILAALFSTAALLVLLSLVMVVLRSVVPDFGALESNAQHATMVGLLLAYASMLTLVYALAAWLIWRRRRWNMAVLLAIAACFGFPVGPVLGIAALVLLTRPAVRASFG